MGGGRVAEVYNVRFRVYSIGDKSLYRLLWHSAGHSLEIMLEEYGQNLNHVIMKQDINNNYYASLLFITKLTACFQRCFQQRKKERKKQTNKQTNKESSEERKR